MHMETRQIGDYTVRELTIGEIMDMRDAHPNGGNALSLAMLGAAVSNGTGAPIGVDGARQLPARIAMKLSAVVAEFAGNDEGAQKNA